MKFYPALVSSLIFPRFHNILKNIHESESKTKIVFVPGCGVNPSKYKNILSNIKDHCNLKNTNPDIYLAEFTGNIGHRLEIDKLEKSVKKSFNYEDDIFLIGHSSGGPMCIEIAEKVKASGMILWDSSFNSKGLLPWKSYNEYKFSVPSLTLLSEKDKRVPFPIAAIEYIECMENNSDVSVLKNCDHFTGLNNDHNKKESLELVSKISDYICSNKERTSRDTKEFIEDYSGLLKSNYGVSKTMEYITGVKNNHVSTPPDMILTILYITMPSIRSYIHGILFSMFLVSKPSQDLSYSYSPLFNFDPLAKFNLPSLWVKIDRGFNKKNTARDMNIDTFYKAHELLSNEQKKRYRVYGKKLIFGDDIIIPPIPGICPLIWLFLPILVREKEDCIIINSPVLKSGSQYNTKLISKENFIEYLTLKAF